MYSCFIEFRQLFKNIGGVISFVHLVECRIMGCLHTNVDISNTIPITGALPYDKAALLSEFDKAISSFPEQELRAYRKNIRHL